MNTRFQARLLINAALLVATALAAPAEAQTRTDDIPFRVQKPDLVLLRDGRVLTGNVHELNEQLVVDTPEPVVVPRSLVSLILVNSQEFPTTYPPLLMTEDAVLLKDGSIQQGHVTIDGEDVFVNSMRLKQSQVRLIKLKEIARIDEPPPEEFAKHKNVRPLGFWVGQFRAAVVQEVDWSQFDEKIPQVVRYNGQYSVVLREGREGDETDARVDTIPGIVWAIDREKADKLTMAEMGMTRPGKPGEPPIMQRGHSMWVEKWAVRVRVDDCDSYVTDGYSWSRTERPDMTWNETLMKGDLAEEQLFGGLSYAFAGKDRHPVLHYQLNIPWLWKGTKADGSHPAQDWIETNDRGSRSINRDARATFMPWFWPEAIHGSDDIYLRAEPGAMRIRGSQATALKRLWCHSYGTPENPDRVLINHAVMAWDFRWHPPGKVPDLPSDDEFDLDTELDQLQAESEWLQEELQNFQTPASDSSDPDNPASAGGPSPQGPPGIDWTSQPIESLWNNRQELQIERVNVQPAIDVGTAISKVEKPGEPGSPMPAGELLALHRCLTGVMRHAFPAEADGKADQEEKQQVRAANLSVERADWLSRLQTAQDLVQRAVEHRLRFEANRIRAKNHVSK